jgi:hypothetical protein
MLKLSLTRQGELTESHEKVWIALVAVPSVYISAVLNRFRKKVQATSLYTNKSGSNPSGLKLAFGNPVANGLLRHSVEFRNLTDS